MSNPFGPTDDPGSQTELERIIAICDRFEAAWNTNQSLRIEDLLAEVEDIPRPRLVQELIALEVELRRSHGDRPTADEYTKRFPDQGDFLAGLKLDAGKTSPPSSAADSSRNLLFGILALQNNFISRDDLLTAFNIWVADKTRNLGSILVDRATLDTARRALLEALVVEHLKQHGGDPEASLAALSSLGSVRDDLGHIPDADLQASLSIANSARDASNESTVTHTPVSRRAGDRFRVLHFHKKGGLGQVYVAHDEELNREVALKEILPDKSDVGDFRSRFLLEAEINGGLEHPGIVPVYSLGTYNDGRPFYAMRFIQGDSLKETIESYHKTNPRPDPTTVEFRKLLGRFIDVCEAISYAHSRGVLHRDLKPHNIMLGRYGETLLIDWGLAKATGTREPSTADGPHEATLIPSSGSGHAPTVGVMGSPPYMSPEQAEGKTDSLGATTDVYSLGATLYALLTGQAPVKGTDTDEVLDRVRRGEITPPRSLNPRIPRALEAVCLKALALSPVDRYPTAQSLADDVEDWLADKPVSARRDPLHTRAGRWARKHQVVMATVLASLIVGLAATLYEFRLQWMHLRTLDDAEFEAASVLSRVMHRVAGEVGMKRDVRMELFREAFRYIGRRRVRRDKEIDSQSDILFRIIVDHFGQLALEMGKPAEALAVYDQFITATQGLSATNSDPQIKRDLAFLHSQRGLVMSEMGQTTEAMKAFDRARVIYQKLANAHPGGEDQRHVEEISDDIGMLLRDTGDLAGALKELESSEKSYGRLKRIGMVLRDAGDLAGALKAYQSALVDLQRKAEEYAPEVRVVAWGDGAEVPTSGNNLVLLGIDHSGLLHIRIFSNSGPFHADADIDETKVELREHKAQWISAVKLRLPGLMPPHVLTSAEKDGLFADAAMIKSFASKRNRLSTYYLTDRADILILMGDVLRDIGDLTGAMGAYESAVADRRKRADEDGLYTGRDKSGIDGRFRYDRDLAIGEMGIGSVLNDLGDTAGGLKSFDAARAIYQRLADSSPDLPKVQSDLADSHIQIGRAKREMGDKAGAIESFESARVICDKLVKEYFDFPCYRFQLGTVLNDLASVEIDLGNFSRARGWLREAIAASSYDDSNRMTDRHLIAKHMRDLIRADRGVDPNKEAVAVQREIENLNANMPSFDEEEAIVVDTEPEEQKVRHQLERLEGTEPHCVDLDARLKAVMRGKVPKDHYECLTLARRAYDTEFHAVAAHLWSVALDADPRLTQNRVNPRRYQAAGAAALAGCGKGKDDPPPDDEAKAKLRVQAQKWLRLELTTWAKLSENGPPQAGLTINKNLRHWLADPDLAGVREEKALATLPEAERTEWQRLWAEVDVLLERTRVKVEPPKEAIKK